MQPEAFFEKIEASEDELRLFLRFDDLFMETAGHTNLVARASLPERWARHYEDSAQLYGLIPPRTRSLLDIGSGGGFPVIVLAIMAASRNPALRITAVDSVGKKARFLERAGQALHLDRFRSVHGRVEDLPAAASFDVVTARAVTELSKLLDLAAPRLEPDGVLIAPKGRRAQQELDAAKERWSFEAEKRASVTDPEATILLIRKPKRRS